MRLTFEAEHHTYMLDGKPIPGVSEILTRGGVAVSFFPDPATKAIGSQRGVALHLATQYLEEGTLDWNSIDPIVLPYVRAYERFLVEERFRTMSREQMVYSKTHWFAGTLDRTGVLPSGGFMILDLKTKSGSPERWWRIQTAGYALAEFDDSDQFVTRSNFLRGSLHLKPDGSYGFHRYDDKEDLDVFLAARRVVRFHEEGEDGKRRRVERPREAPPDCLDL